MSESPSSLERNTLAYHEHPKPGKLEVVPTKAVTTQHDLSLAYTPGVKVKELAEQAGSTAAAFYMRLKRLRRQLMQCVEQKSGGLEATL